MLKQLSVVAFAGLMSLAAAPARADDLSKIGVGPHGLDFLIGQTMTCRNNQPGPVRGPAVSTSTVVAGSQPGRLTFENTGPGSGAGYNVYVPSKKTWVGVFATPDGSYGSETMISFGPHNVWQGTFTDALGHTMKVRDTFTNTSFLQSTDVSEANDGSGWKVVGKTVCIGTKH
jgi:hypothetical protein